MTIENILTFISNNKISLLLTFLTSLPAVYFTISEFLKGPVAGQSLYDGAIIWKFIFCIISILLCGFWIFHLFTLGIKWLFVIMIFLAPIIYYYGIFIAVWVGFIVFLIVK